MKKDIHLPRNPVWKKTNWKKTKIIVPFCPVCKEELFGNNSSISPYKCSCGEWKYQPNLVGIKNGGYFRIKKGTFQLPAPLK